MVELLIEPTPAQIRQGEGLRPQQQQTRRHHRTEPEQQHKLQVSIAEHLCKELALEFLADRVEFGASLRMRIGNIACSLRLANAAARRMMARSQKGPEQNRHLVVVLLRRP